MRHLPRRRRCRFHHRLDAYRERRPISDLSPEIARPPDRATAIGTGAIGLWATLAALTAIAETIPAFELAALAFGIAFLATLILWAATGTDPRRALRLPARAWIIGVGGLFGYHALFFLALRNAPLVEANLINYLWPLLIVLMSALLPGEGLRWHHIIGCALGFAGALFLTAGNASFEAAHLPGYLAALAAAFIWASYSVASRLLASVPSNAVGIFCGVSAILALLGHLWFETTIWPQGIEWLAVLALGLGPMGLAFMLWDIGMKKGDIRTLGTIAYATPLLSTLLLMAVGRGEPSLRIALAALLIVAGGTLAAWKNSTR